MEQSSIQVDNQQERQLDVDVSWLAGIVEGEGCINLYDHPCARGHQYMPRVVITNTDKQLIDAVHAVLKRINVGHYYTKKSKRDPRNKECIDIYICGFKRIQTLLEKIIPFMRGEKTTHAMLVWSFCRYRLTQGHQPYTEKDHTYFREFRNLIESSTTIR